MYSARACGISYLSICVVFCIIRGVVSFFALHCGGFNFLFETSISKVKRLLIKRRSANNLFAGKISVVSEPGLSFSEVWESALSSIVFSGQTSSWAHVVLGKRRRKRSVSARQRGPGQEGSVVQETSVV